MKQSVESNVIRICFTLLRCEPYTVEIDTSKGSKGAQCRRCSRRRPQKGEVEIHSSLWALNFRRLAPFWLKKAYFEKTLCGGEQLYAKSRWEMSFNATIYNIYIYIVYKLLQFSSSCKGKKNNPNINPKNRAKFFRWCFGGCWCNFLECWWCFPGTWRWVLWYCDADRLGWSGGLDAALGRFVVVTAGEGVTDVDVGDAVIATPPDGMGCSIFKQRNDVGNDGLLHVSYIFSQVSFLTFFSHQQCLKVQWLSMAFPSKAPTW